MGANESRSGTPGAESAYPRAAAHGRGAAEPRTAWARYGVAVLSSGVALAGTVLLSPVLTRDAFLFFYLAVSVSAWYGGLGPGLCSAALGVAAVDALFVRLDHPVFAVDTADMLRLGAFVVVAGIISSLSDSLRVARRQAETRAAEADRLYREARAELAARVTAERRLEELMADLDAERARLEAVVQQMPAGVSITLPSGRVLLSNAHVEEIFGRPIRPLSSIREYVAFEAFHADGRPYSPEDWPIARSLRTGEEVSGEELEIVRGDGTRATIRASAAPVRNEAGEVVAGVVTYYDVTEQKRSYDAQRFLAEASAVLASTLDHEATLRSVARLVVSFLADWCLVDVVDGDGSIRRVAAAHRDPAREHVVRELLRYPPHASRDAGIMEALRTGRPQWAAEVTPELRSRVARGEEHASIIRELEPRSYMAVPMIARGNGIGVITFNSSDPARRYGPADVGTAQDLARLAALAVDNARLYRDADAANRAKAEFLATMSHELRTPLTTVIGYTDLLRDGVSGPVTDAQRVQLERVRTSAWHLLELIEQILSYARIEAGRDEVRAEPLDLGQLVREAAAFASLSAREKGLELDVDAPERGAVLVSDAGKIRQILLNLVNNAVKFTEHGAIRVSARLHGAHACFTVSDTGIGIEAEHLERIFDPFWQVDQSSTRLAGGTGLGLAVSRRLAQLLGGDIEVSSEPGAGTTFTLRLPAGGPG